MVRRLSISCTQAGLLQASVSVQSAVSKTFCESQSRVCKSQYGLCTRSCHMRHFMKVCTSSALPRGASALNTAFSARKPAYQAPPSSTQLRVMF